MAAYPHAYVEYVDLSYIDENQMFPDEIKKRVIGLFVKEMFEEKNSYKLLENLKEDLQLYNQNGFNDFWFPFSFPKLKEIHLSFLFVDNFLELSIVPNLEKLTIGWFKGRSGEFTVQVRGEEKMMKLKSLEISEDEVRY